MTNPTSNQCLYCGRENDEHNEVCVYADNVRVRAERNDALEILKMALPGPRPWSTESIPSMLRIYREMAIDKRRSSAVETSAIPVPSLPMRMDQPWSLPEVLGKLIEATEHSLAAHSCDTHGHELFRAAANAGRSILREWQNTAQQTSSELAHGTKVTRHER